MATIGFERVGAIVGFDPLVLLLHLVLLLQVFDLLGGGTLLFVLGSLRVGPPHKGGQRRWFC